MIRESRAAGLSRRELMAGAAASLALARPALGQTGPQPESEPESALSADGYDAPAAWRQAAEALGGPVLIDDVAIVRVAGTLWVRVRSRDGDFGAAYDNGRLLDSRSLAERRAFPSFLGQDARRLPKLVDRVYRTPRSNYKFVGMPFWNGVASFELAVLDLVGRRLSRPVAELIGEPIRDRVPVYVTRLTRDTTADEEVRVVERLLAETGARAVKLKIGGRMQNRPKDVERTNRLVPLARRVLGDDVEIFVDANGSYTEREAIRVGRMLEDHQVGFFEEPCPWEEHDVTPRVADVLNVPVAGGEQDSSLPVWRWMIARRGFDLCQPDVYYCGGLFRSLRIARWAAAAGLDVTPHSPKGGWKQHAMLSLAGVLPNLGPYQECVAGPDIVDGYRKTPSGAGFDWPITDRELRDAKPA